MGNRNSKTIKILLKDGSPQGLRTAEIGGSSIKTIIVPRNKIKEIKDQDDLNTVGIYFLIGDDLDESTDLQKVYIGEAEEIFKRINQHNTSSKEFWDTAIIFINKDDSLTKAHVKYLENYCHNIATELNRCILENSTIPAKTKLPEIDIADMDDFFANMSLLMSTFGYPIFSDPSKKSQEKKTYICKGPNANAKGKYIDEGFIVLSGSISRKKAVESAGTWVVGMIKGLKEKEILKEKDDNSYEFITDRTFKSPSAAAAVVLARRANGWIEWKDKKGMTLDKNERV